jgi:hypothetical protein
MNILATAFTNTNALIGVARTSDSLLDATRALLRHLMPQRPAPATIRDPIREAGEVRRMADTIRFSDPRFAADLYAAADRHERIYADATLSNDPLGPVRAAPAMR